MIHSGNVSSFLGKILNAQLLVFTMEGLQHDPCQMGQVKTKVHEGADAMEEQTCLTEAWSKTASALSSELVVEDAMITIPLSEPLLGLILRMPAILATCVH